MMTVSNQEDPAEGTAEISDFSSEDNVISFRNISNLLWQKRWPITAATLFFTIAATIFTLMADDKFQASIVISPVSDESGGGRLGGLASLASQLGGLGSLGLSVPGNMQKVESIAVLQSEALTERYITENNLLPLLYDSKWDSAKNMWKDMPPEKVPTLWKANRYFKMHIRSVLTDSKTGLVTMTISWKSPHQVAKWANGLVKLTNDYLRSKAIEDSERNIAYLKEQLTKTSIIGLQAAINSLLESEMKKAMLAQGSREYALKVIDPAVVPEKRSSPVAVLWILTGFLLGLSGSIAVILLSYFGPMRLTLSRAAPRSV
jgi:capsular polysaccharide biosynthesis protein